MQSLEGRPAYPLAAQIVHRLGKDLRLHPLNGIDLHDGFQQIRIRPDGQDCSAVGGLFAQHLGAHALNPAPSLRAPERHDIEHAVRHGLDGLLVGSAREVRKDRGAHLIVRMIRLDEDHPRQGLDRRQLRRLRVNRIREVRDVMADRRAGPGQRRLLRARDRMVELDNVVFRVLGGLEIGGHVHRLA